VVIVADLGLNLTPNLHSRPTLVWVVGFRHVGGKFGAVDVWVFWVTLVVRSERWRVVWSMAGDAWVGDRWPPSLAGNAWRTAMTPGGGQWLSVREERATSVEREMWVGGLGVPETQFPLILIFLFLFFGCSIKMIQLGSSPKLVSD